MGQRTGIAKRKEPYKSCSGAMAKRLISIESNKQRSLMGPFLITDWLLVNGQWRTANSLALSALRGKTSRSLRL
jgi:hypothetical protein